jgi:ATP-dependent RNA helicase DDX18/HAS1
MNENMINVAKSQNFERPSKIQALTYKHILEGKSCILADQTGSGKTLAYLLPTLQRILELKKKEKVISAPPNSPYIVIIAPTTELASQVARVVKSVSNVLKFRTACLTAINDADAEQKKLRVGAEVLIATPGRLISAMEKDQVSLEEVKSVILDEADVLFLDQSFPLQPIGSAAPLDAQFIFATATLPTIVTEQILKEFPDAVLLSGPGLHRISPVVEEVLIDCSGPPTQEKNAATAFENKRLALMRSLEQTDSERTLIFCNTIAQCRKVENALNRADRQSRLRMVYPYHGAIDADSRADNLREFCRPLLRTPVVMVSTDRASRGIDFDRAQVSIERYEIFFEY